MKLGPDVIQPQPQLISGPCNTPLETKKKKKTWLGVEGRDSAQKARVRDAIQGAAGPGESAEGKIRGGGCGRVGREPGSQRGGWGYSLLCRESLRRLPRAWLAVIQGGTGSGGPPLTPLFPIHLLESHNGSSGPSRVEGWSSTGLQNGRKWAGGVGLEDEGWGREGGWEEVVEGWRGSVGNLQDVGR